MRLYGKEAPLRQLTGFRRSGRFPHALMLCGEKGSGRRTLAEYAAAMLLCENGGDTPCGSCVPCMKIAGKIHPDVIYPLRETEKGRYEVGALRALTAQCCKSPNDGALRVLIFEDADEMSPVCQNALLKFIEEPLPFNCCIFTVQNKTSVLATVLSRVTCVEIGEADRDECVAALIENGVDRTKAEEMYSLFGGNIGKCLNGANDEDSAFLLNKAGEIAKALCSAKEYECAAGFSALKNREDIGGALYLLAECFAGAANVLCGGKARGALSKRSEELARNHTLRTITRLYDVSCSLSDSLESNPNAALMSAHCCESLFTALEEDM